MTQLTGSLAKAKLMNPDFLKVWEKVYAIVLFILCGGYVTCELVNHLISPMSGIIQQQVCWGQVRYIYIYCIYYTYSVPLDLHPSQGNSSISCCPWPFWFLGTKFQGRFSREAIKCIHGPPKYGIFFQVAVRTWYLFPRKNAKKKQERGLTICDKHI